MSALSPDEPARSPLRYAGRILAGLVAAGFLALLAYGVLTKSADTTIDDALSRSRSVDAPGFDLAVLGRGTAGRPGFPARGALSDGRLTLDELRGTPVVLNFWASWCTPCREEAPVLERAWRSARGGRVLFLGLDMQDISEDALAFSRHFGVSYPTIRDRGNDVARSYGVTGVPETFFISARGRIVGHVVGVVSPEQLRAGGAAALAGRPAGVEQGGERRPTR